MYWILPLYYQISDGIQKDLDKVEKHSSFHDSVNITFTLIVVKKVKMEKAGIYPETFTQVNSPLFSLSPV